MMRAPTAISAVALCGFVAAATHGQTPENNQQQTEQETIEQLREEVRELRRELQAVREEHVMLLHFMADPDLMDDMMEGMMMEDNMPSLHLLADDLNEPELAALAAIEIARVELDPEQRVELFSQVLREVNEPPMLRNAAYLALAEAMGETRNGEEDARYESARLLQNMITENARRWQPNSPQAGEQSDTRVQQQRFQTRARGPVIVHGRPPGARLWVDSRHRSLERYAPHGRTARPFDPRFDRRRMQPFPYTDPAWRGFPHFGHFRDGRLPQHRRLEPMPRRQFDLWHDPWRRGPGGAQPREPFDRWERQRFDRWERGPEGLRPRDPFDR